MAKKNDDWLDRIRAINYEDVIKLVSRLMTIGPDHTCFEYIGLSAILYPFMKEFVFHKTSCGAAMGVGGIHH
ncbi:MAG: hypothetical protein LBC99_06705 [Spirochaetota bacterium]|jgi:hypothetical protein|nr:hypothetical protein [Spirochaetota bacterium]